MRPAALGSVEHIRLAIHGYNVALGPFCFCSAPEGNQGRTAPGVWHAQTFGGSWEMAHQLSAEAAIDTDVFRRSRVDWPMLFPVEPRIADKPARLCWQKLPRGLCYNTAHTSRQVFIRKDVDVDRTDS